MIRGKILPTPESAFPFRVDVWSDGHIIRAEPADTVRAAQALLARLVDDMTQLYSAEGTGSAE